jgi:UDP-N-acetyl-2-amino-2-deoxyglucuronate dehydrogenase
LNNKIGFSVIGCGHIGKRHIAMINSHPEAELAAVCDVLPETALGLEKGGHRYFTSVGNLLDDPATGEVVCIATPNGLHEEIAVMALKSGRNVVIEKPMALTKASCERILFEALNQHRQVFCVMQNRYSPPSQWLKEIVAKGILGKIYQVQVNCYWNRDERYYVNGSWHGTRTLDGGTLFTQFSHFIDMLFWLFGDITNIQSRLSSHNHRHLTEFEDSGVVLFDFVEGGMGSLNFSTSCWDQNLESSITIIAENGSVKVGGQYMNEVDYCHVKNYTMPVLAASAPPNDYGSYKGSAANHHYIFENVIDVLKGRGSITTNAMDGLKVVDIIERIYAAGR